MQYEGGAAMAEAQPQWPSWRLLGLDVGDVRIGVATSDPTGIAVSPLCVIRRQPEEAAIAQIAALVADEEAVGVVAGLPLHVSGDYSDQTRATLAFTVRLAERLPVPLVTFDERYTTTEAERILRERGVRRDRWREQIDAIAASVILQDYLDAHKPRTVPAFTDDAEDALPDDNDTE
jgi:putative holliday junction resolvase